MESLRANSTSSVQFKFTKTQTVKQNKNELVSEFLERKRKHRAQQFLSVDVSNPSKAFSLLQHERQPTSYGQRYGRQISDVNRKQIMSQQSQRNQTFIPFNQNNITLQDKQRWYLDRLLIENKKFEHHNKINPQQKFQTVEKVTEQMATFVNIRQEPVKRQRINITIPVQEQEWKQMKKKSTANWKEFDILVDEMKQKINPQFFAVVCQEKYAQKQNKVSKKLFYSFLAHRYGKVYAEKWQCMFDFSGGALSMEQYQDGVAEIFKNKKVMTQIAFDFYDTNNDDKISEMDLFKILFVFGKHELFKDFIHQDLVTLVQILQWKQSLSGKQEVDFRKLIFLDQDFVRRKKKVLTPIYDFKTKTKENNWVHSMIRKSIQNDFVDPDQLAPESPRIVFGQKSSQHVDKKSTHVYITNRPAARLLSLSKVQRERSKLQEDCCLTIVSQYTNDQFLTNYFEQTKGVQNVTIDMQLFNNISFQSGFPMIVVDLFYYLFGVDNESCQQRVQSQFKSLKERVAVKQVKHKSKVLVPPLKQFIEEVEYYESSNSDQSNQEENPLMEEIKNTVTFLETRRPFVKINIRSNTFQFFQKLGNVKQKKLDRIMKQNEILKIQGQDLIEPSLHEYTVTEQSILKNFEQAFGSKCDVFAKILYVKASGCLDHCKLSFKQICDVFTPLIDVKQEKRNLQIFKILDLDGDGILDLLTLLNIYKQLPYRCLFKHEIFLLLKEYKDRNVLVKQGYGGTIQYDYDTFSTVIPKSTLAQFLCHKVFGFYMPYVQYQIPPDDPFITITHNERWEELVSKHFPKYAHLTEQELQWDMSNLLDQQQVQTIYDSVQQQPKYVTSKLK